MRKSLDDEEYLGVSKLSIIPKDVQPKIKYNNPKSMRVGTKGKISAFNTSYYNTNHDSIR